MDILSVFRRYSDATRFWRA